MGSCSVRWLHHTVGERDQDSLSTINAERAKATNSFTAATSRAVYHLMHRERESQGNELFYCCDKQGSLPFNAERAKATNSFTHARNQFSSHKRDAELNDIT